MSARTFTHVAFGSGAAAGMTLSGRRHLPAELLRDRPLVVAIHGGTYTSTYFDVPGYSLVDRAAAMGIPIVALDRPGYGTSTPLPAERSTIAENALVLREVIGELWAAHGGGAAGVVLIGHSIGGAIATTIAASEPAWPLLGVAISGCLLHVPPQSRDAWAELPPIPTIELPVPLKDGVMFGPAWTHDASMPAASYVANAPVPRAELIDVTTTWIESVRATAAKVTVPVHHRQGEFDALWITNVEEVTAFRAAFVASADVDARLLRSAGHCIDFHRLGAAFQLDQLSFALRCCVRAQPRGG